MDEQTFQMHPIGTVRRAEDRIPINIQELYRPALQQLDKFSHVMIFWWAEYRPNPIAMTTCNILAVDEAKGEVRIAEIDA